MANVETNQLGAERRETRSVPQLMRDFIDEVTALLRDEASLAQGEIKDNITEMRNGLLFLGAGAIVLIAGLVSLLDAAVVALMPHVPTTELWLAPLIVGLVVVLIGVGMLLSGRSKVAPDSLAPESALRESRRDRRMLEERLS